MRWRCLTCDAHGDGDKAAEHHTRDTTHPTMTSHTPTAPARTGDQ